MNKSCEGISHNRKGIVCIFFDALKPSIFLDLMDYDDDLV